MSLGATTLAIQHDLHDAAAIADFRVSLKDDDGNESIRVAYTVAGDDHDDADAVFAAIEGAYGLQVQASGSTGDGFYLVYVAVPA